MCMFNSGSSEVTCMTDGVTRFLGSRIDMRTLKELTPLLVKGGGGTVLMGTLKSIMSMWPTLGLWSLRQ